MFIVDKRTGKNIVLIDGDELNVLDDENYAVTEDDGKPIKRDKK